MHYKPIVKTISLIAILTLLMPLWTMAADYDHTITLEKMNFEWKLDPPLIRIRLSAQTKGWVSVGFNPTDRMAGADFIIGYVKQGVVKVQDHFGIRSLEHIKDELNNGTDDIIDISGKEEGNTTTIEFAIPLDSGDENDSKLDPNSPTRVLLAFGPDRDSFYSRHVYRTALTVNLKTGEYK